MSALPAAALLALMVNPACGADAGIPTDRMLAVVRVESGGDPLALNLNGPGGGDLHPATLAEAIAKAQALLAAGRSIDLGLTQINGANLASHGLTVETAFDPCASLRAGAEHLAADFQAAWRMAHSRYNSGSLTAGTGYAARIEHAMGNTTPTVAPAPRPAEPSEHGTWDVWAAPPMPKPARQPIIAELASSR